MKTCSRCKESKQSEDFYPDKSKASGLSSQCRPCRGLWGKTYRESSEVKEAANTRSKKWYADNVERARKYAKENPEDPVNRLLRNYGMTRYEYDLLLVSQNHKCAVCESPTGNKVGHRLVVDHDHSTGQVRGLLCHSCNRGIGMLRDSAVILKRAFNYLKETQNVDV